MPQYKKLLRHAYKEITICISAVLAIAVVVGQGISVTKTDEFYEFIQASTMAGNMRIAYVLVPDMQFIKSHKNLSEKDQLNYRIAWRLKHRLMSRQKVVPSLDSLKEAIDNRQKLLASDTGVRFTKSDGSETVWNLDFNANPLWIKADFNNLSADFVFDTEPLKALLETGAILEVIEPENAVLTSYEERDGFFRVETEGVAKSGDDFNPESIVANIKETLEAGGTGVTIHIPSAPGEIVNETGEDLGDLKLIATGQSNFKGSTYARMRNVRKALNEHVNNTLVAPGETFSFNSTLEGPVSMSNGWSMAKIIVEGDQLADAPGGGICQASTTTYRALLNAGLVEEERRAHSLYVYYYEKYGVGIDATIFPGQQDLKFVNDTGNYMLVQAYDDGYEAVVNIYGTDDGRTVEFEGPYFADTAPEDFQVHERELRRNEIAWIRKVTYPDGEEKENLILSRYKSIPVHLVSKYTTLHASADEEN